MSHSLKPVALAATLAFGPGPGLRGSGCAQMQHRRTDTGHGTQTCLSSFPVIPIRCDRSI